MIDPIVKSIEVPCPQQRAFEIFVDMASWWPLSERSMSLYQAEAPAKSLLVDARLNGRIVEIAADDVEHHWGTFRAFDPHAHLQMDFHMGLPADQSGRVDVTFTPIDAATTKVELVHSNWEGYGDMANLMLKGYGGSWDMLFGERYAAACGS